MNFRNRVESGQQILIAEISPPMSTSADEVCATAQRYSGKVHALGVSESRDHVGMSALAAASLAASQGIEPILHMTTRDRNRIALISDCLGARALGIMNLLCTSGTHQTLGHCRSARNVSDVDPVQLLQALSEQAAGGALIGETAITNRDFCLGAVASPYADPMDMQIMRLEKKLAAGATFLVTQPAFDMDRFRAWWDAITAKGLQKKAAVIAGVRVLTSAEEATALAAARPSPCLPASTVTRMTGAKSASDQRTMGIKIALETIEALSSLAGLRGFEVRGDGDPGAALEVIEKSGVKV
ncbi:MAG: methylenetetrahydrofolate reductase [Kiritimatiellae bacterium]|nr:methylenetetrahydrofolate reductase [Kiritimatiellia bacterium]